MTPDSNFGFPILSEGDLYAQPEPDWLVRDLMHRGDIGLVFGAFESFKTFFFFRLAYAVATGRAFCGHDTTRGVALVIEGEGSFLNRRRLEALQRFHGDDAPSGRLFFALQAPQLATEDRRVLDTLRDREITPDLIIVDPISSAYVGGKEALDFSPFIAGAQRLRDTTGAAILLGHHTGWRETHPRGHTSLPAAVDVAFSVERIDKPNADPVVKVSNYKNRHAATLDPMFFQAKEVELRRLDEYGDPITSVVLVDSRPIGATQETLNNKHIQLLKALGEVLIGSSSAAVRSGVWQEAGHVESRTTFTRLRDRLVAEGLVESTAAGYALSPSGVERYMQEVDAAA